MAKEISCNPIGPDDGQGFGEPSNYLQEMANKIENIKCNLMDIKKAGILIADTFEMGDPYLEKQEAVNKGG